MNKAHRDQLSRYVRKCIIGNTHQTNTQMSLIWPQSYKTFFMLNSAEHEICPANKFQITKIANCILLNIAEY